MIDIKISSPAFADGDIIPAKYTCDGSNVSPPLTWGSLPEGTQSLALISEDPDAPSGNWVHWLLYNFPPLTNEIPEALPTREKLEDGARQGITDSKTIGYRGPCPPNGIHRYYFRLYALDAEIDLKGGATKEELLKAMEGHVLGYGECMGRYSRQV